MREKEKEKKGRCNFDHLIVVVAVVADICTIATFVLKVFGFIG